MESQSKITVPDIQLLTLRCPRLILEPVTLNHVDELHLLLSDPTLHQFTPQDPPTHEIQLSRCEKWAKRISPAGDELWLNWAARFILEPTVVGHFQAGIKADQIAVIGYLISRDRQGQGLAKEALASILFFLKRELNTVAARAFIDTRNASSLGLIESLGFKRTEFIKEADYFKGGSSDEWVYELKL